MIIIPIDYIVIGVIAFFAGLWLLLVCLKDPVCFFYVLIAVLMILHAR